MNIIKIYRNGNPIFKLIDRSKITVFDSAVSGEYQETPEGHEIIL